MGDTRHEAPIRSNSDNGQEWSGDMDAMNQLFAGTNPDRVIKAGKVYSGAAAKFANAVGVLRSQTSALAGVWKGDDADATVKQMKRLQESAQNLHQVSDKTGKTLADHGEKLKWYREHQPKEGFFKGLTWNQAGVVTAGTLLGGPVGGLIGLTKGDALGLIKDTESKAAVDHVKRLSVRAREANTTMPERISTDLPQTGRFTPEPPPPYKGGGMPTGGGGMPSGGGGILVVAAFPVAAAAFPVVAMAADFPVAVASRVAVADFPVAVASRVVVAVAFLAVAGAFLVALPEVTSPACPVAPAVAGP